MAEKLAEITPGDFEKHSILVNSGAEAVENAVKIARVGPELDAAAVKETANAVEVERL